MKRLLITFKCDRVKTIENDKVVEITDKVTHRNIKDAKYFCENYKNQNFSKIKCISSIVEDVNGKEANEKFSIDFFNEIANKAYAPVVTDKDRIKELEQKLDQVASLNNNDKIDALIEQNKSLMMKLEQFENNKNVDDNSNNERSLIIDELSELNIQYDGRSTTENLRKLLIENKG